MSASLITALMIASSGAGAQPVHPIRRAWTFESGKRTEFLGMRSGTLLFTAWQRLGALNPQTGKVVWEKLFLSQSQKGMLGADRLWSLQSSKGKDVLVTYSLAAGKELDRWTLPGGTCDLAVMGSRAAVFLNSGRVIGFIAGAPKPTWSQSVAATSQAKWAMHDLTAAGGGFLAAVDGVGWRMLEPKTGRTLWSLKAEYATLYRPIDVRGKPLVKAPKTMLLDGLTGKPLWESKARILRAGLIEDLLVAEDGREVHGINCDSGKVIWTKPLSSPGPSLPYGMEPPLPKFGKAIVVSGEGNTLIDKSGEKIWSLEGGGSFSLCHADEQGFVFSDYGRLFGYCRGPLPKAPSDEEGRRQMALQLVKSYELLDEHERKLLNQIGASAAPQMIERFLAWHRADPEEDAENGKPSIDNGMARYRVMEDAAETLMSICGPEHTQDLLKAINQMDEGESSRETLWRILSEKGKAEDYIDSCIKTLKDKRLKPSKYGSVAALETVAKSSHPRAVAYMIEVLKDKSAPSGWRQEAFVHLAGTGGAAGVQAVKEAKPLGGPRPTWESTIDVDRLDKRDVLSDLKDAKGQRWRLFQSEVLGCGGDLFIVKRTASGWEKPIFTGLWRGRTWDLPEPKTLRGVPVAKFVKSKWVKVLPGDASLSEDHDQDGLTDVAERRLGTNLREADTDKDGVKDSVDPCPNAAPRAMTDAEKVFAAVMEARFFGADWGVPAYISIKGVEPFEMTGYLRPLIWEVKGYQGTLPKMYGSGVNSLGFAPAGGFEEKTEGQPIVKFGPDGKSAATLIRRYSGGLNGDGIVAKLIKVDEDWFVISLVTNYVS